MARAINRQIVLLSVLLCLEVGATMLAMRRDPVDRFRAVCVAGLVWVVSRRIEPVRRAPDRPA